MNAETMGGVERRGVNCLRIKNTIEKSDTEKLRLKRWKMKIHDIILILILNLSNTNLSIKIFEFPISMWKVKVSNEFTHV